MTSLVIQTSHNNNYLKSFLYEQATIARNIPVESFFLSFNTYEQAIFGPKLDIRTDTQIDNFSLQSLNVCRMMFLLCIWHLWVMYLVSASIEKACYSGEQTIWLEYLTVSRVYHAFWSAFCGSNLLFKSHTWLFLVEGFFREPQYVTNWGS